MEVINVAVTAIKSLFIQPVWYVAIITAMVVGSNRSEQEKRSFNVKVYSPWLELKNLFTYYLFIAIPLSVISFYAGFSVTIGWLIVFNIVTIFLLILTTFKLSSLAISISVSSLVFYFCYFYDIKLFIPEKISYANLYIDNFMTAMTFMLALLLFIESYLIASSSRRHPSPLLQKSRRGKLLGAFDLKKLWFLPFIALVPGNEIQKLFEWWPIFNIGSERFSVIIIPLVFGMAERTRTNLPEQMSRRIASQTITLAILTVLTGVIGVVFPIATLFAFMLAIIARIWNSYRFYQEDKHGRKLFLPQSDGLVILGTREKTPSSRLHLQIGEKIIEVNDRPVANRDELYRALTVNRTFCKLKILDRNGEPRFEQTALYENEPFELGLLLVDPKKGPHN